ncbi:MULTISPECIES: BatA domain-containing protein [unclassified Arcicella]|uniref:BatA domain-containing protein n=1 Tax=unclassified Arcicella TaxID=2644986 RepID=UPI0028586181|nr:MULTISPECIES: BatA domain-containing protein [unclassified Arcicella]MDR6562085.1 RNA-binding protein YhbY [Arcicella sp. BE51]MDR6811957.1 RNA-binding protein YhbY [Arcicella sp. BE140]MDR6822987.1 RNA-binding protein YhbY [Arcicella sp. BE139]
MELLNPLMLWGALAIAVPIIIHFWHQKKGKVIDWAATNWLIEKNLQQSRGIRLDNIFLLVLRCLLLLLLCLLLSKPLLHTLNSHQEAHKVHLVQKNSFVVNNYKFELEEALKKGEKCYWFTTSLEAVIDFNQVAKNENIDGITIQNSLNQLSELIGNEQINMYFVNSEALASLPHIFVPNTFSIHSLKDSSQQQTKPYLAFEDNKKVFIGSNNLLTATSDNIANGVVKHTGLIKVLIENNDDSEKQSIKASLAALSQTYQLAFQLSEKAENNVSYDIIFSNSPLKKGLTNNTLYFFSNTNKWVVTEQQTNQILIPDLLNSQHTEMVYNGLLPEFLGEKIIQHFGLQNEYKALSHQQLNSLFKAQKYFKALSNDWFPKSLLLIFILLLALERWIAIYKNS